MEFNINSAVRSAVILAVAMPVSVGAFKAFTASNPEATRVSMVKAPLVGPCLGFMSSKPDSKLERQSQDEIDSVMGGDGADYKGLCGWILN